MPDKSIIDLAIIIPTLNEEFFIGKLLDSIAGQTVRPKEVVVVDACSQDKTISEIKKRQSKIYNLRFFKVKKRTISRQRNYGVEKTKSPHLLFLDADMELKEEDALERYFNEILERKPDTASARNLPDENYWKNLLYFKAENLLIRILKYFWPTVLARNLYIKREIFNRSGRFDENIPVGEDQELVQRIVKKGGRLIFLKKVNLYTSSRRIEEEGRRRYAARMVLFGLNIFLRGHKKSRVRYDFGHFKKPQERTI